MRGFNRYGVVHCCCGHELGTDGVVYRSHHVYTMSLQDGKTPGRNGGTKRMRKTFRVFAMSLCTTHSLLRVRWEFLYYYGVRSLFTALELRRTNHRDI